jgi:hydroxymethylpyrimidine/phosphomethylpyrimidine kinase
MRSPPTALTIAGSDSGGGAGIQADLKTFQALGVFGMSAITAVTAQNTRGVTRVDPIPPEGLRAQIEAVFADLPVGAVKLGMLATAAHAHSVADALEAAPLRPPIVVDPVMIATSGDRLLDEEAVAVIVGRLLPLAALATPNLHEAEALDRAIGGGGFPCPVLITRGDAAGAEVVDSLILGDHRRDWAGPRHPVGPVHGTGCTLAAAIAARLAWGDPLEAAIDAAIGFTREQVRRSLAIGGGSRVLPHGLGGS